MSKRIAVRAIMFSKANFKNTYYPCTGVNSLTYIVGFCSESCAEKACSSPSSPAHGLGRHCYECDSLLPCLLLDNYAGWPKSSSESIGGTDVAHLAFACVADTDSNSLLDFVCETGRYQSGPRHQVFVRTAARATFSVVFNPVDYGLSAWLVANTEYGSPADVWQLTVATIFLTCCLFNSNPPLHHHTLTLTPTTPNLHPARLHFAAKPVEFTIWMQLE
ncbi:unnamed protein product [Mesocestoides corti]|uniref:Uncharacterized protein n=1 Tax=Mesocestoides corti TaxID=53468 RepID=A0A0R3UB09_MESCO|nr:unnamed protein product [Mesocestoides corti]